MADTMTCFRILEVALRALNACCLKQEDPAPADEACLRQAAGDHNTAIDDLACQIIQRELRLRKDGRTLEKTKLKPRAMKLQNDFPQLELTSRETQVLLLIAQGLTSKKISQQLGISFKTAVCHRSRIMSKLDVHETASLVRFAVRQKLIEP